MRLDHYRFAITRKMLSAFTVLMVFVLMNFATGSGFAQTSATADSPFIEVARLGRGIISNTQWKTDGEAFLVNSNRGAWIYSTDFEDIFHFELALRAIFSHSGDQLAAIDHTLGNMMIWETVDYELTDTIDLTSIASYSTRLAWSPDDTHIAIGTFDEVKIYDVAHKEIILTTSFASDVLSIEWSPDGNTLAVGRTGALDIAHAVDGTILHTFAIEGGIVTARWSPDNQTLATLDAYFPGGGLRSNAVRLWDAETYQLKLVIQAPVARTMDWTPDGSAIVVEDYGIDINLPEHYLKFWSADTGELLSVMPSGEKWREAILSVEWNTEGDELMVASEDNLVRFYDWPLTGNEPRILLGHSGPINNIQWSVDSTQIASASEDSLVHIWDVDAQQTTAFFQSNGSNVWDVAWLADGKRLALSDDSGGISVLDTASGEPITYLTGHGTSLQSPFNNDVYSLAWSPDGQWLASGGSDETVRIWDMQTFQEIKRFDDLLTPILELDWSTDSRQLAFTGRTGHLWHLNAASDVARFDCNGEVPMKTTALSPDGHFLAVARDDFGLCIWDTETHQLLTQLNVAVEEIDWKPDGTQIAVLSTIPEQPNETSIWLLDAASFEELTFIASLPSSTSIAWSPDGEVLAVGNDTGLIYLYGQEP